MSSESSSHELSLHSQTHQPSEQSKASNTMMNMSSKEFNAAWEAHIKTKPWSQFFEARSSQNKAHLQRETDEQCQCRLNHEFNPPIISAEVYEWDWSDEDPLVLIHTQHICQTASNNSPPLPMQFLGQPLNSSQRSKSIYLQMWIALNSWNT